jgi:uncharacterized protein
MAGKPKKQNSKEKKSIHVVHSYKFSMLKGIFVCPVGAAWDEWCDWNSSDKKRQVPGPSSYQRLWEKVMENQEFIRHPRVGDALQDFWLERLLENPNPFHFKADLAPFKNITHSLIKTYEVEIKGFILNVLRVNWEKVIEPINRRTGLFTPTFGEIRGLDIPDPVPDWMEERKKIKKKILEADFPEIVKDIADYFHRNGFGAFGRYWAFRWIGSKQGTGHLEGIEAVDPIRLENLLGYDEARKPLLENIEAFVAGKPANNVLIYGERGTGKSSTVKALLNAYGHKRLRIIEVHPEDLRDYLEILNAVRGRPEKFILFLDDLSFEENETSYKGLKALLDGTVEAPPDNILLIATSNRRHLVQEFFAENLEGLHRDGEVHGQDTVEQKLSLSDRFGLVVSFYTPSQDTYLNIVQNWAKVEGLDLPPEKLKEEALRWSLANNGRSGRTARQFINDLKGKTK